MPFKDPEKYKQWRKEYKLKNRQKILNQHKSSNKKYYQKNKEQLNLKSSEYQTTPTGRKSNRISGWKRRGLISDNYDELYEYYLSVNNCENCDCILNECNSSRKCLDHNHTTGEFRNVLCQSCNIKRQ